MGFKPGTQGVGQADGGALGIGQNLIHPLQPLEEFFQGLEVIVARQRDIVYSFGYGASDFDQGPLHLEDLAHIPFQRGGDTDETQGFPGGGAVQDNDLEFFMLHILVDIKEQADFFHARQNGQFLGQYFIQPGGIQQQRKILMD